MRFRSKLCAIIPAFLSVACSVSPPKNIKVVNDFDSQRYLGTWYEIARFDHRFERGLEQVTANYSPREDGGLKVVNRGFNRYALVCGPNRGYLWILSRTPTLDAATRDRLVQTAKNNGFDTDKLIWVKQTQHQ
ncbi:MAG: lipocalin family protein [Serratia liquefaciens]|nr:lipocalin family protein [Serratia liquefaciens]